MHFLYRYRVLNRNWLMGGIKSEFLEKIYRLMMSLSDYMSL